MLEAILQLAGWEGFRTYEIGSVWAAIANPNLLAAMRGMTAALTRVCSSRYAVAQRVAVGFLLVGVPATSILTVSAQGPATRRVASVAVVALRILQ